MIGPILVFVSWALLRVEGKGLSVLGFNRPRRRALEFGRDFQSIRFLGKTWGCGLSAVAFGVYHWFSFGVFGDVGSMAFVFLLTAAFGLMASVAFANPGSVALPIGLPMGWNLVAIQVFSDGPIGPQLLVAASSEAPTTARALTTGLALPLSLPALVLWRLHTDEAPRPCGPPRGPP